MTSKLQRLHDALHGVLGGSIAKLGERLGELTLEVKAADYHATAQVLRDHPDLRFQQLIDLCGVDYNAYGGGKRDGAPSEGGTPAIDSAAPDSRTFASRKREPCSLLAGARFAAVAHLLSVEHNWRLRVRAFCPDNEFPVLDSLIEVWPSANWFEREAFDLFGIVFTGHPDLRRILTDYGFVGHPFRKDFPVSGTVEMRYDPDQQRVIYQPVTIDPREIVPRIVREENYADVEHKK